MNPRPRRPTLEQPMMAVPDTRAIFHAPTSDGAPAALDHLTDVLEMFPLDINFAGRFELGGPWGLAVPEGVAVICTVIEGNCLATADTAAGVTRASAGDVLLLSPGAEHRFRDTSKSPVAPAAKWTVSRRPDDPLVLAWGGPGATTVLVGGVLRFGDPLVHPFCWGLPPVVHLVHGSVERLPHLRRLVSSIDEELSAALPGRLSIVKRFVEILFVETARLCLVTNDDSPESLMGPLLHPDLGPALALMHRQPERPWTVAELAERVAMSRSAFAAAFVHVLGRPPLQYLRQHRMELAGRLLRNPSLGLKEVAQRVGYDSVSAFNSAFKRSWGVAPGRFRSRGAA